jgi:CRISPR-associated protein Cas5t
MENLLIKLVCQTATFRNPDFQNFHKTLDFPPPTTIIGLVGAAMGFSPLKAQEYCYENRLMFGIYGNYKGKCKDTWKYSKKTKEMWLYSPGLDGSIIQKEYLIHANFFLLLKAQNEIIEDLKNGFECPVFALTLGNSDSIAKVEWIKKGIKEEESTEVENTVLEGNVIENVLRNPDKSLDFSVYQISEPFAFDLPISFEYQSDYGRRTVNKVKTLSFISSKMILNYSVEGVKFEDKFIPFISLQ